MTVFKEGWGRCPQTPAGDSVPVPHSLVSHDAPGNGVRGPSPRRGFGGSAPNLP
jgi:hypothetical protein